MNFEIEGLRKKDSGATTQRDAQLVTTSPRGRSLDVRESNQFLDILTVGGEGISYRSIAR